MSFTQKQNRKLNAKLRPQYIKTRDADGVSLSYLEGWHVIAEANRIFGFDGWDRVTLSSECVWTKMVNGRYCAAYVTRVRIRVRAGEALIVREGSGAGESNASSPGQAHEFASKASETDATKRAFMTFGNAFGLSLYGGLSDVKGRSTDPSPNTTSAQTLPVATTAAPHIGRNSDRCARGEPEPMASSREELSSPKLEHFLPVAPPLPDWPEIKPLDEAPRLNRERRERIDKSALALSEPRRTRHSGHLAFVASRPCLICGRNRSHAHHLKFAQPTALGRKVSDEFTVPLCSLHHRELHQHGDERIWWSARGIDALTVAADLWSTTCASIEAMPTDKEPNSLTEATDVPASKQHIP